MAERKNGKKTPSVVVWQQRGLLNLFVSWWRFKLDSAFCFSFQPLQVFFGVTLLRWERERPEGACPRVYGHKQKIEGKLRLNVVVCSMREMFFLFLSVTGAGEVFTVFVEKTNSLGLAIVKNKKIVGGMSKAFAHFFQETSGTLQQLRILARVLCSKSHCPFKPMLWLASTCVLLELTTITWHVRKYVPNWSQSSTFFNATRQVTLSKGSALPFPFCL